MPAPVRVYVDMVGDLFHAGHVELLRSAAALGDEVVVGVLSDASAGAYKREPVMSLAERVAVVEACRYVAEVVPDAPLVLTRGFLDRMRINLVVHGDDLDPAAAANNQLKVMLRTLNSWRDRPSTGASRRLHLHFWHAPVEITGEERVEGIRFARTAPDATGAPVPTGEVREYDVQAVYRAIGYYGTRVAGAGFDERRGVVPNEEGRVLGESGAYETGLYATGWIKRGPVGLIGHTKSDALETVGHLVADAEAGVLADPVVDADVLDLLDERETAYTTWDGWLALDAHERALGESHEHVRERVKVVARDEQVEISRPGVLTR